MEQFPWDAFIRESVGGAVGLVALLLFLKFKPWKNGTHTPPRSGDMNPAEWETRIRIMIQEEVQDVIERRNETLRKLIRESVRDAMQYFYGYKKAPDE